MKREMIKELMKKAKLSIEEIYCIIEESGVLDEDYGSEFEELVMLNYKMTIVEVGNLEFKRYMELMDFLDEEILEPEHEELLERLMINSAL